MYENVFYNKYNMNVYSQNGEDGVIEEILKRLDIKDGWVCEFGAWDGKHLSNTYKLVKEGFKGVYIEGDKKRYKDLLRTVYENNNIIPLNYYVGYNDNDENLLDNILSKTDIPSDFDILSIDIDSYDYQVWKSLREYKPKIVIIEINSGVRPDNVEHIHTSGIYQGTGFRAMYNLGIDKGYKFVLHTGNMIFIREELYSKLNLYYENELENFRVKWLKKSGNL